MNSISMKDLHERFKHLGQNEIILDVRGPEEYSDGHIPGAINIPHDQVGQRAAEVKKYSRIYIHCKAGMRAQVACAALEKQGVGNLMCVSSGGMMDWISAGYETAKG